MRRLRRWPAVAIGAGLVALGLVGCGGDGGGDSAQEEPAPSAQPDATEAETAPPASAVPDVTVVEVASGTEVALGSLVPSERPVLVWFWAPH